MECCACHENEVDVEIVNRDKESIFICKECKDKLLETGILFFDE